MADYVIFPEGAPSHTSVLEARLAGSVALPAGMIILWRQNGAVIKSGITDDPAMHRINTGDPGDVAFDATDTGSVIDFFINGTTFSSVVLLSNNGPTLSSAGPAIDGYGKSSSVPTFSWVFNDLDGDPQYSYRVKVGTSTGLSDLHDSGTVLSSDSSYDLPEAYSLSQGSVFYWKIEVSDGEKTVPEEGDSTADRVLVSSSGTGFVNIKPVVYDVKINGESDSPEIPSFNPVISWSYSDVDGQPQQAFRVLVSKSSTLDDPVWDSGFVTGSQSNVTYNYDRTGLGLESHVSYYVGVHVKDTLEESDVATEDFQVAHQPVVTAAFVNDRINPLNLRTQNVTFTWAVSDKDNDPITGYEIRVADSNNDLGTDSFAGSIWHPGFRTTRETFEVTMGDDGNAFPGCVFPKQLQSGITYYFQVKVRNGLVQPAQSAWFTGFFRLNNVPEAANLRIIPESPFGNDDLSATWTFVDDPNDVESSLTRIKWYKNDEEQLGLADQRTVSSGDTEAFDQWYFTVQPHDGIEYGLVYVSSAVTIGNRPPVVSSLRIDPVRPKTDDSLTAIFIADDPDGDDVSLKINWYKDGVEQPALRNRTVVPPFMTSVDEAWTFSVTPSDRYVSGNTRTSSAVTIENSRPEVKSLSVDEQILPTQMKSPNPLFSWAYSDADMHEQKAYHLAIGTKLLRTTATSDASRSSKPKSFFCVNKENGIVSVSENGDIFSGNDVFDSGVVQSATTGHRYATEDYTPSFSVSAPDIRTLSGYELSPDLRTISLGRTNTGTVVFRFPAPAGAYEPEITYLDEDDKASTYQLLVDGIEADKFTSQGTSGTFQRKFKSVYVSANSDVSIRGMSEKGKAAFDSISFLPISEFEIPADEFDVLSGYVSDGNGGIRLVGLAGSAILNSALPSGTYDIEFIYVTETSGSSTVSLSVNNSVVDSFSYETGVRTRSRFITGVNIVSGDRIKINGARGGSSSARVKSLIFRPTETLQVGTKLKDGLSYYASVRVYDGREWSDWYTTRFSMKGWAWASSVSNATGWTIESRFSLVRPISSSTTVEDVAATEAEMGKAASVTTDATAADGSDTTIATPSTTDVATAATTTEATTAATCNPDTFQGIRFYDGTAFGWLRLLPDKVELLVSEPMEYELDGFDPHTFRITAIGKDINLYVDNELAIGGTGKFTQPTSRKVLEFGDIAGREQVNGSSWESFRYSVSGPYAPNALVDYDLDEVQRFADASIGRMKTYGDRLYVSVDSNDPEKSSKIFRFEEGVPPESRSVLALTRAMVTAVVTDPNRSGNGFGTSGKFIGTQRGLQYLLGSKPFPYDMSTLMAIPPEDDGWSLETTCTDNCLSLLNGAIKIDTTGETGASFFKYTQRRATDPWPVGADNTTGWTVEVRVKVINDGYGSSGIDKRTMFVLGGSNACDPATGISVNDLQTVNAPTDDGLDAPGIVINDGRFEEIVQFFGTGVRLKYAAVFADQDLTDQFHTIRIIGKDKSIAVYSKGDKERFYKRLVYAPEGLHVKAQPVGDHELPAVAIDGLGIMHVAYQDSRDGYWAIYYTKTMNEEIVARGSGLYSQYYSDFDKFVKARPGFGLSPDTIGNEDLGPNTLFSGGSSFISWGVKAGDVIYVFSRGSSEMPPRKFRISSVPHETILRAETEEDLSEMFNGVEFVIARGEETWLPPIRVSPENFDSTNPRIAIGSGSEILVAYQNSSGGNSDIFMRRGLFDPFYTTWKESARITNSRFDSSRPDVARRPNGKVVAVWQDSRSGKSVSQIFASEIMPDEIGVTSEYANRNLTPDSKYARNPRAVAIGDSIFVVYEDDPDDDGKYGIYAVRLDDRLDPEDPVEISVGAVDARSPAISMSSRDVFVAYTDTYGEVREVYVVKGAEAIGTVSWESPERITDSRGDSLYPDIKADNSGNIFVLFQDDRVKAGTPEIYVSRFNSRSGQWLSSGQDGLDIRIESYVTSSDMPSMGLDSFGNLGITWRATKDGDSRIARVSFDGLPTMDKTVVGYFPMDDNGQGVEVKNKVRETVGSVTPYMDVVLLVNKSNGMSGTKLSEAKSVANGIIAELEGTDSFNVMFFDTSRTSFRSDLVQASSSNLSGATSFVSGISAGGSSDLNQALIDALGQGYVADDSRTKLVVLIDDGHPNAGELAENSIRRNVISANDRGVSFFCFGLAGANATLLGDLSTDNDGTFVSRDAYGSLSEALADFVEAFVDARNSRAKSGFFFADDKNGEAFYNTDLYHTEAPDSGVSLANPASQGGFGLDQNGKGFRIDASLLHTSGALDVWMKPNWVSTDLDDRVLFGNAPPSTVTPNSMVCGFRSAPVGNDFYLRAVDGSGYVRETSINNSVGSINFDWSPGDNVHIRAIWDQNAVGTSSIRGMSFPTQSLGFACSEEGLLWRTEDGGYNWNKVYSGTTYELYSVDFIDSSRGWACGEFGTVLKTVDGGNSWSVINTGLEDDINGIYFRTDQIGYAVGSNGLVLRSLDGGNTWTQYSIGTSDNLNDIAVVRTISNFVIIAVGDNGKIYRSTTYGESYSEVTNLPVTASWKAISRTHQAGAYGTYVVGSGGAIVKTSDLGLSWTDLSFDWGLGYQPNLHGVSHGPDSNYVYLVGQNGTLGTSTNGGATFSSVVTGIEDGTIREVEANFGNSGTNQLVVVAGSAGSVMISTNSGTTQSYAMTKCGNLRLLVNGKEPPQTRTGDGPFKWDPSSISSGLVIGDYQEGGSLSINAVLDEMVIYSAPPPAATLTRRKEFWIFQAPDTKLLLPETSGKRIEWGDISPNVRTSSYWSKIEMFFSGAREPFHMLALDSQIGLVDDVIRDLVMDKSGRLWVATEHGISSLDANALNDDIDRWISGQTLRRSSVDRIINYTNSTDGLVSDDVSSIAVDANNDIWAGTSKGLMYLKTNRNSAIVGEDPVDAANNAENDPSSQQDTLDSVKFVAYTVDDGLPSNNILVVEALGDHVFVGTDAGLVVLTPPTEGSSAPEMSVFDERHGLPSSTIRSVAREKVTGYIWVGTDAGLAYFSEKGSIKFDSSSGLPNTDVFSITLDPDDTKYVGTGFGISRIRGTNVDHFQPASGVGFGAILDGDYDGAGHKWFATADGVLEFDDSGPDVRMVKYGLEDGLLGQPNITDYERYFILGGDIPSGGCNKALVNVAINGVQLSEGFKVNECTPWITFDTPRTPSDRVQVCVHKAWREVYNFGGDPKNPDGLAALETDLSTFFLYRKRFLAGTVSLGANFSKGSSNRSTAMYTLFALPLQGDGSPISAVSSPAGSVINDSLDKGETSIYSDSEDLAQVIPAELANVQHVALPSADASRIDGEYLEMTLSMDSLVYVAYDSRSHSLPEWLREFEPVRSVLRVTDMEVFTDATGQEKLFLSTKGTVGCVYDILHDPDVCDISDQIAVDQTPPEGCATIIRLNSVDEAVLALQATDAVTGVSDMQVSAFENFTEDGEIPVGWVPFQRTYNLTLPVEALDPVIDLTGTEPPDNDPQDSVNYPDTEYTIVHEHLGRIYVGSRLPGRVYLFNKSTQQVDFLFDTGEDEVLSMVSFGQDLIIGTGVNGRAFRWNGTTLSLLLLPDSEQVTALGAFDNRVFFGTSPDGKIYEMDQFGTIQLFMDTNETSVNGFAIYAGQFYWATSNDQVAEGDDLTVTTRNGHRHSITAQAGDFRIADVNGTTTEVDGHTHQVVDGVVQVANGHDHRLNGSRSGKVFRLNSATGLSGIVHSDRDYDINAITSTSMSGTGLMFVGTYPNGKILRFIPEEAIFIKSFDTSSDRINSLRVIDSIVYAVADDDLFFFDGRRWQFQGSVADEILDLIGIGGDIIVVRRESLGRTTQISSTGEPLSVQRDVCAYVRFRDEAGNMTSVRDENGDLVACYHPCLSSGDSGGGGDGGGDGDGGTDGGGDVNPMTQGAHRIVEINGDGRTVFRLNGPDPFLSGNRVEEEIGRYYSEVLNGTTSLVQWTSLSWTGSAPSGSRITLAVRSANTAAEISTAEFGAEFTSSVDNDLTNLPGQFMQFRATLRVWEAGVPSPQLDKVDIQLRTSQAVHYFTTNFSLPDSLDRGILTYTGCKNPPVTDIVFGISGQDSVDFSDYFVISPRKVFEVPDEHRTKNLRVGIRLISSPDTVPVVDEFALMFSLANDAIVRLNLLGHPTEVGPPAPAGPTITVLTDKVQGHSHGVTFSSDITEKTAINGQTSINGGHSHLIANGTIQIASGHTHDFEI